MTIWKYQNWDRVYKERLGEDVFEFLTYDNNLIEYLSDHEYIWNKLKPQAKTFQLSDNSFFVLPICKLFEGTLKLIAKDAGWFKEFNGNKEPKNIRSFYRSHRSDIEAKIDALDLPKEHKQDVKDKFFSVINDFKGRHNAVHSGSRLTTGEIENYDSVLTKIKEIVSLCLDIGFISIGSIGMVSSYSGTFYMRKKE